MSENFAVHLGAGIYLDATGKVTFGPPNVAQVYRPPAGFPIDVAKIQQLLKDLGGLLPEDAAAKAKWTNWGVPKSVVDFLSKIAGVAAPVATFLGVYMWAMGAALQLIDALAGDEGLSPELSKALYSIKNQLSGMEQIARADKMIALHAEFDGRVDRMQGLLLRLLTEKPAASVRVQIFEQMRSIVDELAVPLSTLRDQEWAVTYGPDAYKGRAFAAELLVLQKADGSLEPVPMVAPNVTAFDYRLGVPMLIYGATTFAALARIAMPWFRSAGTYALSLRKTADAIDRFVMRMQEECLARTHYTTQKVFEQQTWSIFELPPGGGPRPMEKWGKAPIAVGAFDLVRYDDAFLVNRYVEQFGSGGDTGQRGLFNYHWSPAPLTQPWPSLPDIATAANEQAQADYSALQVTTGAYQLILTANWLRFLSTPPVISETVSGRTIDSSTRPSEEPTTATSPSIPHTGVIEHAATLKRYDAESRVLATTQAPGYAPAFHYRIVLRTLDMRFANEGWQPLDYVGDVWRASYEPAAADARCKRLRSQVDTQRMLSEVVLFEGASPAAPTRRDGQAHLQATTFDWYLPVAPHWQAFMRTAVQPGGGSGEDVRPGVRFLSGRSGPMPDEGDRRHVRHEAVDLDWSLDWSGDKLEVALRGKRDQRAFQAVVVIEETVYSGEQAEIGDLTSTDDALREQIHTPFVAELVNQVVMVPQEFFDEERKAILEAGILASDFERRFAQRAPVGPLDPLVALRDEVGQLTKRSQSTSTLALMLEKRLEFAAREAPELLRQVREQPTPDMRTGHTKPL